MFHPELQDNVSSQWGKYKDKTYVCFKLFFKILKYYFKIK